MTTVSIGQLERARKNFSAILSRLASVGQSNVAKELGVAESTISRLKSEGDLEQFAKLLAAVGLKAVPVELRCYDPKDIDPLLQLARRHLAQVASAEQLAFDDPE
jgi:transcriptional regulator with XRE-family HTH domain